VWAVVGWLLAALALAQGAPFWFDLMGRLVRLRGSGNKPESTSGGQVATPAPGIAPLGSPTPAVSSAASTAGPSTEFERLRLSTDDVMRVQQRLAVLRSGTLDADTRKAIRTVQREFGMTATGLLDAKLIQRLFPHEFA
jgi:hypothetical protein